MRLPARALVLVVCASLAFASVLASGPGEQASAAPSLHYLYGSGSATGGRDISLRIQLTSRAPSGGTRVRLATSNLAIQVPGSVRVPAGQREVTISVPTSPVEVDLDVRVQAELNGQIRSRIVRILSPHLSDLSVQSKMRAGGAGKVTIFLTGVTAEPGIEVLVSSNRPSLIAPQSPVVIEAGRRSISLVVPVGMVTRDTPVNIIVRLDGKKLVSGTLIRNYELQLPTSTPTSTEPPAGTATPTSTGTGTAVATPPPPTSTRTASATSDTGTLTATPSPSPTASATASVAAGPSITLELLNDSAVLDKGSIARFRVCLSSPPLTQVFISFKSSNETVVYQSAISQVSWVVPAGSSGSSLCIEVTMPGRSEPANNLGVGTVNLVAVFNAQESYSEPVTFVLPATRTPVADTPTASPNPTGTPTVTPTGTGTASATPTPTVSATTDPTQTSTSTRTATSSPSITVTGTPSPTLTATSTLTTSAEPVVITLIGDQTTFPVGATVTFVVCLSSDLPGPQFPTLRSSNEQYFSSSSISPNNVVMDPGECVNQSIFSSGATGPSAPAFLIANLGGMDYQSPPVWFVPE